MFLCLFRVPSSLLCSFLYLALMVCSCSLAPLPFLPFPPLPPLQFLLLLFPPLPSHFLLYDRLTSSPLCVCDCVLQERIPCPFPSCRQSFKRQPDLSKHWNAKHSRMHGQLRHYNATAHAMPEVVENSSDDDDGACAECEPSLTKDEVLEKAMAHIDAMKFKHYETDADVSRAKEFANDVMQSLKPLIVDALKPHMHDNVDVGELIDPILCLVDGITSRRREASTRRRQTEAAFPPLKVYPRLLGRLSEKQMRKRRRATPLAYAYDTKFEEILEREFAVDPTLIPEIILAHDHWLKRSREIRAAPWRDPNRIFTDVCDGQAWQEHPMLGDPNYTGPTRIAVEGYCDDVDVPNAIGTAQGHHKLFLSFIILLNRPPRSRMTLRSINLATVCLSKDFKAFGPRVVISDPPPEGVNSEEYDACSNSIGATMRRFDRGVKLKTPPASGMETFPVRGWMPLWTADGMAQGDVYGTNASFSAAINICNRCEDMHQNNPAKKVPCGFLVCQCGDADVHQPGCRCHFRLRTARRDAERPLADLTPQMKRSMGITTSNHGFVDVPHFNVARPGPKEAMHAFYEGRTKHLAAYTLWHIEYLGLASRDELRAEAQTFDWTPGGGVSGFFVPNYLPDKIFTKTKVTQEDGSWVWGPHHDECKVPFSAAGTIIYTIMSLPFLYKFVPARERSSTWFRAWVLHVHACQMQLRYKFSFAELLILENLLVESEKAIANTPAYAGVWTAKAHWILHLAQDIFDWGPSRLLYTMLCEMKNKAFKHGCKRSNFHAPVKSTAEFWALQSDYEARQLLRHPDLRSAVCSQESQVLITGCVDSFPDSIVCQLLLDKGVLSADAIIEFLLSIKLHGCKLQRDEHVLFECMLFRVERIARHQSSHYMLLSLQVKKIQVDEFGMMVVIPTDVEEVASYRLVSLNNASDITGVWTVKSDATCILVPKY